MRFIDRFLDPSRCLLYGVWLPSDLSRRDRACTGAESWSGNYVYCNNWSMSAQETEEADALAGGGVSVRDIKARLRQLGVSDAVINSCAGKRDLEALLRAELKLASQNCQVAVVCNEGDWVHRIFDQRLGDGWCGGGFMLVQLMLYASGMKAAFVVCCLVYAARRFIQ
eukprot:Tamp_36050.p1 GENE.Tamp_36050~~Tamp_36050.p1  ORF type:complete len:176 (+),score=33.05 Tamp_36050:26-529(+)